MTETLEKTFTKKEYEDHGDTLYEIGKADAFQSVLKTEVRWSLWESGKNKQWDFKTIINLNEVSLYFFLNFHYFL